MAQGSILTPRSASVSQSANTVPRQREGAAQRVWSSGPALGQLSGLPLFLQWTEQTADTEMGQQVPCWELESALWGAACADWVVRGRPEQVDVAEGQEADTSERLLGPDL